MTDRIDRLVEKTVREGEAAIQKSKATHRINDRWLAAATATGLIILGAGTYAALSHDVAPNDDPQNSTLAPAPGHDG
jgi:hypothetical protein